MQKYRILEAVLVFLCAICKSYCLKNINLFFFTDPLTPYRSQVTSYKVTPTTSMASTQMQSPIIHVSSTVTVIQSFAATSSSSSLFDHRTMSASSEHFKIGSLTPSIPRVVHSLSTFDVSIKSVSSASHRSHTPSVSIKSAVSTSWTVIYSTTLHKNSETASIFCPFP